MTGPGPTSAIRALLIAVALVAVLAPLWIVTHSRPPVVARLLKARARVVPPDQLPAVEPVRFADMTPDQARDYNATIPFSTDPNPRARPFRLSEASDDAARATDCLAAAVLYEAGDDAVGERAVAQVVLNRVRHPAFPKTVCGVVFEGADRATGCQFTFTCDGALVRHHFTDAAWARARDIARRALAGSVYAPVGYATHYHTDWVVPYWSASLDKIGAVGSHLFFRWTGWWGTPPAFNRGIAGHEPLIAALAPYSPAHGGASDALFTDMAGPADAAPIPAAMLAKPLASDRDSFLAGLDRALPPDAYRRWAEQSCGDRDHCKLLAWADARQVPDALPPSPEQSAALSFSYLRDRRTGFERAFWDCTRYRRADPAECIKRPAAPLAPPAPLAAPTATAQPAAADPGVKLPSSDRSANRE